MISCVTRWHILHGFLWANICCLGTRGEQVGPRLQGLLPDVFLLPQCLLWITEWSPHTLSFSFQDRKTQSGYFILLSVQRLEFLQVRCMASFRVDSKISVVVCTGFLWKFQLEATFGMKANGFHCRRTETLVKAKWIPPLIKTAKFSCL